MFGSVMGLNRALGHPQTPLPQLSPPQRGAPKISGAGISAPNPGPAGFGAGSGRGHGAVRDTLSQSFTDTNWEHQLVTTITTLRLPFQIVEH